ncbi:L-type lectin-domain containing receptor kinase IV.1-like [Tripterygium wilfordii]|uniref:L-type lectin-domain containing receptor kinase IV.1-like n=1 Tax=Tripterygium wilfordii TaxID=458696 RepID=UPI0018F81E29|nr:L-type lectin-domain containing receptor kinase IV.1-like [Tripterygium wilfordii]
MTLTVLYNIARLQESEINKTKVGVRNWKSTEQKTQTMVYKLELPLFVFVSLFLFTRVSSGDVSLTYNGFGSANLSLDGLAQVTSNGLLLLTNWTEQQTGHAFYPNPVAFKNSTNGTVLSFSTTFVFAIIPRYPNLGGHGIAFVIAPTRDLPGVLPSTYLGLFNENNNGNYSNHVLAVELDTIFSSEFRDINNNHAGIDINGLESAAAEPAGYYDNKTGRFINLTLISTRRMQVWVDYDGEKKRISVTLAPFKVGKPKTPLVSLTRDLSAVLHDEMYVGFSSSTGSMSTSHYVLGWSFKLNGQAEDLDLSQLPMLPRIGGKKTSKVLTIGLPVILISLVSVAISSTIYVIRRKRKFAEELEDWELDYGPHRFKFKDLYIATNGFRDEELLGSGGFGRVYKGVLPTTKIEIAVKRVSHESRQGMREFVAEIVSIGRLRHRNIVTLLGYCRRRGELLLVYDCMPNGSLDKYLYDQPKVTLNWNQRFKIIKGVAAGLFYLHEEWEQVVIHRDVKASNVLLDGELNGRLGDFGLARLYDHGTDPQTTHVSGTLGYLAPEHTRTGKATTSTDVFAFGAFLLEVACGRRPIEPRAPTEELILVDWVFSYWIRGEVIEARDPNLGTDYVAEEVEMVLRLGLLCSHSDPFARPSMRQVVQYLEGDATLPYLSYIGRSRSGFDNFAMSYPSSSSKSYAQLSSVAASLLSGGR